MQALWLFLSDPQVQATLSWLGGGSAAAAAAAWTVFRYFQRSEKGPGSDTRSARSQQGIAAAGDVQFTGMMNIRTGIPLWVHGLAVAAILLLLLRGTAQFSYADAHQIKAKLADSILLAAEDGSLLILVLNENGAAHLYTDDRGDFAEASGRWRISDASVCLSWQEPTAQAQEGCFKVSRGENIFRLVGEKASKFQFVKATTESRIQIDLDPRQTYLRTNRDPAARPAKIIQLEDIGLQPGDIIELTGRGTYDTGNPNSQDNTGLIGVFSSSGTLLAPTERRRVPGALRTGNSVRTWSTFWSSLPTDILEDFLISSPDGGRSVVVQIPEGATHLFIGALSSIYSDNVEDKPWKLEVRRLTAAE